MQDKREQVNDYDAFLDDMQTSDAELNDDEELEAEEEPRRKKPKKPPRQLRTAALLSRISKWFLSSWGDELGYRLHQERDRTVESYPWMWHRVPHGRIAFALINDRREVEDLSDEQIADRFRVLAEREIKATREDLHVQPSTREIAETLKNIKANLVWSQGDIAIGREIVDEVVPIGFADDDRYCWARLDMPRPDIDDVDPVNTYIGPFFENIRLLMADRQPDKEDGYLRLLSWLGAVFSNDDLPIVMGLFGEGGNGKSKLIENLHRKLGDIIRPQVDFEAIEGPLGQKEFKRRRLINIDEPKHGKVVTHCVKRLTNKWITARGLYENYETFRNHAMIVFTSNHPFETDGSAAHNRRLVWCEILKPPPQMLMSDEEIEASFDAYWPQIVRVSLAAYAQCKGVLPMSQDALNEGAERFYVKQDSWLKKHLVYAPGAFLPKATLVEMIGDRFTIADIEKRIGILREPTQPIQLADRPRDRPEIEWRGRTNGIDKRVWMATIGGDSGRTKEAGWKHVGISQESVHHDRLVGRWIRPN